MQIADALRQLGLNKDASEQDVKQAYKDLARIWHPDRFQSDERLAAKTEDQIKLINEAKMVALDYLKKHGHFRFVKSTDKGAPRRQAPPAPHPYKEKTVEQEAPADEPEPGQTPEPEPAQEPVLEEDYFEDDYSYSDYMPGQNVLIAVILMVVLVGFLFIMGSSFTGSPKDKVEAYLKKREQQQIPKNPVLEKIRQQNATLNLDIQEEDDEPEPAFSDSFFTLGSTKEWVMLVQGPPFQIKRGVWEYGFSFIQFEGDTVVGWTSSELNPLSIGILPDTSLVDTFLYFDIGSELGAVIALQGTPDIIDGSIWMYGEATVQFDSDTVVFWENDQLNSLQVEEL